MSTPIKITDLGFDTWLELYDYLKAQNLHNEQKVTLSWPAEELDLQGAEPGGNRQEDEDQGIPRPDQTIMVSTVRSHAFEEVYERLPTEASLTVIREMVQAPKNGAGDLAAVENFLNNLPTRS